MTLTLIPTILILALMPEVKTPYLITQALFMFALSYYLTKSFKPRSVEGKLRLRSMTPPTAFKKGLTGIGKDFVAVLSSLVNVVGTVYNLVVSILFFLFYTLFSTSVMILVIGRIKLFEEKKKTAL